MQDQLDSRVHKLVKKVDGNDCQIVSESIADVRTRNSSSWLQDPAPNSRIVIIKYLHYCNFTSSKQNR